MAASCCSPATAARRWRRGAARKKIIGTNPWSVAAPAGQRAPFVVDMANTGVARGKIYLARNKRLPIPLGWAINSAGEPTTDPQEAIDGIILPMAEHKGYAIAAMVDMLSGVLTGSGFLSAVHSPYKTAEKSNCGHLMIAMNITAFQPLAEFNSRMEQFIAEIKAVPTARGFDESVPLAKGSTKCSTPARSRPATTPATARKASCSRTTLSPTCGASRRKPGWNRSCRLPERCRYT